MGASEPASLEQGLKNESFLAMHIYIFLNCAVQCSAVRFSKVKCNAMQCSAVQFSADNCGVVQ